MACPQIADGGDALQVSRVAANILNKHSQTAEVLQLGGWAWGYKLLTVKNKIVTKFLEKPRTWTNSVDK
jgi:hypothetical protein